MVIRNSACGDFQTSKANFQACNCTLRKMADRAGQALSMFWSKNHRLIIQPVLSGASHPVASVEKCYEQHESDQEDGARSLQVLQQPGVHGATADRFDQGECDVPAIKYWKWQQ